MAIGIGGIPSYVTGANMTVSGGSYSELLDRAQFRACATSLSEECVQLLGRLSGVANQLTREQQTRLHYLQAWQAALDRFGLADERSRILPGNRRRKLRKDSSPSGSGNPPESRPLVRILTAYRSLAA